MVKKETKISLCLVLAGCLLAIMVFVFLMPKISGAELIDNGNGTITDTEQNIMWPQNANLAGSTMNWNDAMLWADTLSYGGYDDWRLPDADSSCSGYNCADSEIGNLFYGYNINSESWGPFLNIEPRVYWSGTEVIGDGTKALRFNFNADSGYQGASSKTTSRCVWPVRDGDSPMAPEPVSSVLFMVGAATLYVKKRKK